MHAKTARSNFYQKQTPVYTVCHGCKTGVFYFPVGERSSKNVEASRKEVNEMAELTPEQLLEVARLLALYRELVAKESAAQEIPGHYTTAMCDNCGDTYHVDDVRRWQRNKTYPVLQLCMKCRGEANKGMVLSAYLLNPEPSVRIREVKYSMMEPYQRIRDELSPVTY